MMTKKIFPVMRTKLSENCLKGEGTRTAKKLSKVSIPHNTFVCSPFVKAVMAIIKANINRDQMF